jgi:hypothetical protein
MSKKTKAHRKERCALRPQHRRQHQRGGTGTASRGGGGVVWVEVKESLTRVKALMH